MSFISTSTFCQELPISPATCLANAYRSSTNSSQNLGAPSAKVEFYIYVDAFLYVSGATLTTVFPLVLPIDFQKQPDAENFESTMVGCFNSWHLVCVECGSR